MSLCLFIAVSVSVKQAISKTDLTLRYACAVPVSSPGCKASSRRGTTAPATPRATAWRSVVRASAVAQRGQWCSPVSRSHRRRWVVAARRRGKWRSPHRRPRGRDPDPTPHPNPTPYPNPNPPRTLTLTVLLPPVPPYPSRHTCGAGGRSSSGAAAVRWTTSRRRCSCRCGRVLPWEHL